MGLITQILIAMVAGSVVGLTFGKQAVPIGVIGDLIIQLIKTLAIPLVFFAILEALVTTVISHQLVGRFFKIIAINSVIAITIGLLLSNVFHAGTLLNFVTMAQGKHDAKLEAFAGRKIEFSEVLSGYIPQSFLTPFADNNMVGIIILALLVGLALRKVLHEADHAEHSHVGGGCYGRRNQHGAKRIEVALREFPAHKLPKECGHEHHDDLEDARPIEDRKTRTGGAREDSGRPAVVLPAVALNLVKCGVNLRGRHG